MLQPPKTANASAFVPAVDPIAPLRAALRGHYDIEREIGQGAFATVYLARDLKHERKVAIKVLNADPRSDTGELRFIREIRLLARLQHPNILPLHDSGHVEALLYYVMPYVQGETLRDKIDRERQIALEDAACIAQESADALACAHSHGVVHRDIKPENILMSEGHAIVSDFGIARAIDMAGIRQLTRTGVGSPGTPAYMAPEQLLGDRDVDARSDIYSLGCVLFEMLTGKPPFAGSEGFVKRFTEAPTPPSGIRQDLPEWADDIVLKSLARDPAKRFSSAEAMGRALTLGLARERAKPKESPASRHVSEPQASAQGGNAALGAQAGFDLAAADAPRAESRPSARKLNELVAWSGENRIRATVMIFVALAVISGFVVAGPRVLRAFTEVSNLNPDRFVVLPLASNVPGAEPVASRLTDRLYEAMRSWTGIELVPDLEVDDALGGSGRTEANPRTLSEALGVARRLGAGKLLWGHVLSTGNTFLTRVELYDLVHPEKDARQISLDRDPLDGLGHVAAALLAQPGRPAVAIAADGQTHNYKAWQAYNTAQISLARWDIANALSELQSAVAADPDYPAALFWLAQLEAWRDPMHPDAWRPTAKRAVTLNAVLSQREQLLSRALVALGERNFPGACAEYRRLTTFDSTDFSGWYGLGECQALDPMVVPDPASPSHWRFRASYGAAANSFKRALLLQPSAHALLQFDRLKRLLPIAPTSPIGGSSARGEAFAAYPALVDDTLAFVPYPLSVFGRIPPASLSTLNSAMSRNLQSLFDIATQWVSVSPSNPNAFETLAEVLEARGNLADSQSPTLSAVGAATKALGLSQDRAQIVRLHVRLARLHFKNGQYAATSAIADSPLSDVTVATSGETVRLAGLAALTGRIGTTARLARSLIQPIRADTIMLSNALADAGAQFLTYSAFGICGDTIRRLRAQLDQQIQSSIPEDNIRATRIELESRPLSLLVPCTDGASALDIQTDAVPLYRLQKAFARHEIPRVRSTLVDIEQSRRSLRPTDLSIDQVYQEAWIRAAIGDTAGSIRQLDRTLNALPTLSGESMREPGSAAALGRIMALRADLAAKTGDRAIAQRWGAAVAALWARADRPLQPLVARMRLLATENP